MKRQPIDFDKMYDAFDKMEEMKRFRPPTNGYFPTLAEINTMIESEMPYMIEYLIWLDSHLTSKQRLEHKDALSRLRAIVEEVEDINEGKN